MTAVRRSARTRRLAESVYDDAGKEVEARESISSKAASSGDEKHYSGGEEDDEGATSEENGNETEEESPKENAAEEAFSSEEDSDAEDFEPKPVRKPSPKKREVTATTPPKSSQPHGGGSRRGAKKVPIKVRPIHPLSRPPLESKTGGGVRGRRRGAGGGINAARRAINTALAALARKVLEQDETPENSLVAGLLNSYKADTPSIRGRIGQQQSIVDDANRTIYTTQLEKLARSVVQLHNTDPNAAQVKLINLLFRSVGGTAETNLDSTEDSLEEMDNDEWTRVVTDLVEEMHYTPVDRILLCADPDGAIHTTHSDGDGGKDGGGTSSGKTTSRHLPQPVLALREYRKIYEEFWYILGLVAMSEGNMSSGHETAEDQEDEEASADEIQVTPEDSSDEAESGDEEEATPSGGKKRRKSSSPHKPKKTTKKKQKTKSKKTTFTSTIRFDAELVRDLMTRIIELVSAGQPDIRAAATLAALQMGHAILDSTIVLGTKIDVATRQLAAATGRGGKGKSLSRKAESLKNQVDSLSRSRADLEEVVLGLLIETVFIHRYRDSNMHVRATCLHSLSRMSLQRPDLFLMDKYLKYLGWMLSDKADCVRVASLSGLLAPFDAVKNRKTGSTANRIDLAKMEHVCTKFLPRLADCAIDVSLRVQENGMALLLAMLRAGFMDDVEDENVWNQINFRALARDASPAARRDALYFIMEQLEAFDEGIDEDDDDGGAGRRSRGRNTSTSSMDSSERRAVQRIDALASWVAHALTDGPIPIENIQIDLVEYVVASIRDMPEHRAIITNWSAMLRAIGEDSVATTTQQTAAGDRADVAKQRVLVQMLACAARAEVGAVADSSFLLRDVDADVAASTLPGVVSLGAARTVKKGEEANSSVSSSGLQHESLSVSLLRALPDLLIKFKSDLAILGSLTSLPRYLIPTVFSLPQRKTDFTTLTKNLAEIYLQSADEIVLRNTALSLSYLSSGDHTRAPDARLQLQKVTQELRDRLLDLFSDKPPIPEAAALDSPRKRKGKASKVSPRKRKRSTRSSTSSRSSSADSLLEDEDETAAEESVATSREADIEYALYLNLKRLRVLTKRCNISEFLSSGNELGGLDTESESGMEALYNAVVEGLAKRLQMQKILSQEDMEDHEAKKSLNQIWNTGDKKSYRIIAKSIHEGLSFLLALTAWKLRAVQEAEGLVIKDDDYLMDESHDNPDDEEEIGDHIVLRLRNRLVSLVELCFEQFLPDSPTDEDSDDGTTKQYSPEPTAFSDSVQASAGQIASDLRTLFPKEWADAASPLLRALAISEDGRLIAGFVRFFRAKEEKLRNNEELETEDKGMVLSLLLPAGRSLVTNWQRGNRREAGIILAHITGSGQEASAAVSAMSKHFKRIEPVRLLEAHMACLRQSYEEWLDSEPDEMESDRPTDAEMAAFEEAERKHQEQFQALEHQAARLSSSLGLGKLSDPKLAPALLGFVREGVRYAFSNDDDGEHELVLGSRLSFLAILRRYVSWIKRHKGQRQIVEEDLDKREAFLRRHPEFAEVHEDDLAALASFRSALGIKVSEVKLSSSVTDAESPKTPKTQEDSHDEDEEEIADEVSELNVTPSPSLEISANLSKRLSRGSSVGSMKSRLSSARSSLSPLYEEPVPDTDHGADESTPSASESSPSSSYLSPKNISKTPILSHGGKSQSTYGGKTQSTYEGHGSVVEDVSDEESEYSRLFNIDKARGSLSTRGSVSSRSRRRKR